jgi:hypothetical protein
MKHNFLRLVLALFLVGTAGLCAYAQGGGTTSTLTGVVVDTSGGVIPGAEITVKNNATAAEFKTVSSESGTFAIPALSAGTYTATVSVPNFKQSIIKDIVLVAAQPSQIRVVMQVGGTSETVTVQAGAEIVQTQSANIVQTLSVNQVMNLPMATRNVMDFLVLLPGVQTTGGARNSTFAGMPASAVNITIDGINTMDNSSKEGFFSYISPRLDAVQEVSVSTATPGAESSGTGAVQVRFVTRSGNNEFHGSVYEYFRNPYLNSNYWFNNRDRTPVYQGTGQGKYQSCTPTQLVNEWDKCKAPKDIVIFNQFGGRIGGPIMIPKLLSGRDRAFFFINYEEFRLPSAVARTRTFYEPAVDTGDYIYLYQTTQVRSVNVLQLAAAKGQLSTVDPNVAKVLAAVRSAANCSACSVKMYPELTNPLLRTTTYSSKSMQRRQFLTTRFDLNITSKHRVEGSWNYSLYGSSPDNLNSADPPWPGFQNQGAQTSNRFSTVVTLRSTLSPRLVNEARGGFNGGTVLFGNGVEAANWSEPRIPMGGYRWSLPAMSGVVGYSGGSRRNAPVNMFEDTLTWTRSTHNLSFGGTWQDVKLWTWSQTPLPSVGFGIPSAYDPAYNPMFDATNGPLNFPGATTSQISTAASLYASLTARVTSLSGSANLSEVTNEYSFQGPTVYRASQQEFGFFAQDSWRMRPNLTLNYGARYEFQRPWIPLNNNYSWAAPKDAWGPSGTWNLFKPGASGGSPTLLYEYKKGDPAYKQDYKAVAPTFGFAWTPNVQGRFLETLLGGGGKSVFRGGISLAYNRYGMNVYNSMFSSNPGGSITASRSQDLGNLMVGGLTYPLLYRDRDKLRTDNKTYLAVPDFAKTPSWPLKPTIENSINAFSDVRTPYTISWTFGLQREITRDTAIEVRYVANRTMQQWFQPNLNERNITTNGWVEEFLLAQKNVYANLANNRGKTFAYMGPNTGTYPLPITLKWLSPNALDPTVPANYTAAVLTSSHAIFTNATYNNYLNAYSPDPRSLASILDGDANRRTWALANGVPANFFMVNPDVKNGGAWIYFNGGWNAYDSMQVEVRRRMSKGLMVQASYVWAKGMGTDRLSFLRPLDKSMNTGVLPHTFKATWLYELPIGSGTAIGSTLSRYLDRVVGGWEFQGTTRIQVGNWLSFGNSHLIGFTDEDLKNMVGLRFDDVNKRIYYYPQDIIDQSYKASAAQADTSLTTFLQGAPSGRYVAPAQSIGYILGATSAKCLQIVSRDCAQSDHYFQGPGFMRFDLSLVKRVRFSESKNFELRAEFLNAFNNINFYGTSGIGGLSSGQVTSAYTDSSQQQDNGGRMVQIVMRFNF